MITHGGAELNVLASSITASDADVPTSDGLTIAVFSEHNLRQLRDVYVAVLLSDVEDAMLDLLEAQGVPLRSHLTRGARDEITRSDATELAAAAVLIAVDHWSANLMHMPNVPKMSRAKSDSGIDVLEVELIRGRHAGEQLEASERLRVCSVKHTVQLATAGCVSALKASLSERELSVVYLAGQLRVINSRLRSEGYTKVEAERLFLFLRELPASERLQLTGVAVVDVSAVRDAAVRLDAALTDLEQWERAALVGIPEIGNLHRVCAS
jgi:hypothetical protein